MLSQPKALATYIINLCLHSPVTNNTDKQVCIFMIMFYFVLYIEHAPERAQSDLKDVSFKSKQ